MFPSRVILFASFACAPAFAHDIITTKITFSREISRIFAAHCVSCHREGGAAFSLMTYEEARPWAKAIKEEVLERRMPPWGAVKGFGEFRDDRGLTQEALEVISAWVEGGAPEGDPKLLPAPAAPAAAAPAPKLGAEWVVDGRLRLPRAVTLAAIRAKSVLEGTSPQIFAQLPDGSIEPLLWLYNFNPKFARTYYYARPVELPAGTLVVSEPASSGTISLFATSRE